MQSGPSAHFLFVGSGTLSNADIEKLLEPVVTGMGYELWGVEFIRYRNSSLLRVYIDLPEGIQVSDCERVSRQVSAVMDVEDPIRGQYTLEVSSPGLDRYLFRLPQYPRFIGTMVKIRLLRPLGQRRNFTAILKAVEGEEIVLQEGESEFRMAYPNIEKARLVP
jgi:ribosome maturation factor RimP